MPDSQQKLLQYLDEAHAAEQALVSVLASQIAMTPDGSYRDGLEKHLEETRDHARRTAERAAELDWPRRVGMAADCCRGMIYLHTHTPPIMHRDLKSANLLVTASWVVKVSDFNLSKIMESSGRNSSIQAMNPRWLAPEVLQGGQASLAGDVFAFGVVAQ